jgi:hypothetical protein
MIGLTVAWGAADHPDWHRGAAVTGLSPALSCRSCRAERTVCGIGVPLEVEPCLGILRGAERQQVG